jgi:arabinan endo-1,5-alpha-L-arabinosidase
MTRGSTDPGCPLDGVGGRRAIAAAAVSLAVLACTAPPDFVAIERGTTGSAGSAGSGPASEGGSSGVQVGGGTGGSTALGGAGGRGTDPVVGALELSGDLATHDSCVIEAEGRFTLFHTGPGIGVKVSDDLHFWEEESESALPENPGWIADLVPDATDLWAPDVSFAGGQYHLYYAASTFGSGRSCIGHATTDSLTMPIQWVDQGAIICSDVGGEDVDDWDAIDPSTLTDTDGTRWMVFGSFGSGIKLMQLDANGARLDDTLHALAARPPENPAIQAPFLLYREPYYYLFVSFDFCCQGVSSTYNIRVGRASDVLGPYVDRNGVSMLEGGGTLLLEGNERWRGVGANTILSTAGRDYNVYHSYDANAAGAATLRISEVAWDSEGWPELGGP